MDVLIQGYTFVYKVLSNSAAPTLKDSFLSRSILLNNYNLRNSQTDLARFQSQKEKFLKEALNTAGLICGITSSLKLSKLNQFSRLKIVSNKIFDVNNQVISLPGTHRKFQ